VDWLASAMSLPRDFAPGRIAGDCICVNADAPPTRPIPTQSAQRGPEPGDRSEVRDERVWPRPAELRPPAAARCGRPATRAPPASRAPRARSA
jgi:hypothetical protein